MGADARFAGAAKALGEAMLQRGIGLVYGGAHVGLMGVVADTVMQGGGEVIGVIPQSLVDWEVAHTGLSKLIVVSSMHERKATMASHADAFAALPGGFGTLDELMEIVTWRLLGLHEKPVGLLEVAGYFKALRAFIEQMTASGFARKAHAEYLQVSESPAMLLDALFA
jgi:uncharacterized protein (TIGR00730 family)